MADKWSSDADYKARKAQNSRTYRERNKEIEREKALARASSISRASTAPDVVENRKRRHREAQARYRAKQAAEFLSPEHCQPVRTEQEKQKHREAQDRYRQKNRAHIRLMRWTKTREGFEFKMNMLKQGLDAQNNFEAA